jgi:hypothetical protein
MGSTSLSHHVVISQMIVLLIIFLVPNSLPSRNCKLCHRVKKRIIKSISEPVQWSSDHHNLLLHHSLYYYPLIYAYFSFRLRFVIKMFVNILLLPHSYYMYQSYDPWFQLTNMNYEASRCIIISTSMRLPPSYILTILQSGNLRCCFPSNNFICLGNL